MSFNPKLLNDLQWIECDNLHKDPEMRPYVANILCGILKSIDYEYLKKGSERVIADLERQNRKKDHDIAMSCYEIFEDIDSQRDAEL